MTDDQGDDIHYQQPDERDPSERRCEAAREQSEREKRQNNSRPEGDRLHQSGEMRFDRSANDTNRVVVRRGGGTHYEQTME